MRSQSAPTVGSPSSRGSSHSCASTRLKVVRRVAHKDGTFRIDRELLKRANHRFGMRLTVLDILCANAD